MGDPGETMTSAKKPNSACRSGFAAFTMIHVATCARAAGARWIVVDQPSTQDRLRAGPAATGLLPRFGSQGWAVSASGDAP